MIYGAATPEAAPFELPANRILLCEAVTITGSQFLMRLAGHFDGLGPADGDQKLRGVVYTAAGALVVDGPIVTIPDGMPGALTWLTFAGTIERIARDGSFQFGIHTGDLGTGARLRTPTATMGSAINAPFAAGPPANLAAGDAGLIAGMLLETSDLVRIPTNVDDEYLASLPYDITQRVFAAAGTLRDTRRSTRAGWYGTKFDPTTGARGIVRSDGPLADLVGERIRVSTRVGGGVRSVAVYVHDEREFPDELADEELLLTRRAFLALGNLALDNLTVSVEILP